MLLYGNFQCFLFNIFRIFYFFVKVSSKEGDVQVTAKNKAVCGLYEDPISVPCALFEPNQQGTGLWYSSLKRRWDEQCKNKELHLLSAGQLRTFQEILTQLHCKYEELNRSTHHLYLSQLSISIGNISWSADKPGNLPHRRPYFPRWEVQITLPQMRDIVQLFGV